MKAKILILDIETAPNMAYVWGAWKQNVGANQWIKKGYTMSFAAKWLGSGEVFYEENRGDNDRKLIKKLLKLLDEADIVVAHNGRKFDIPTILGRAVVHRLPPPSPFHQVDTLEVARREFRFVSNSLAVVAELLGLSGKDKHKNFPGFALWVECIKGNDKAWKEMKSYNIQDVLVLEEVYLRMRPYMRGHPNVSYEDGCACPKCGSFHIQYRGYYTSTAGITYRRFMCNDCNGWGRERTLNKESSKPDGRNAR